MVCNLSPRQARALVDPLCLVWIISSEQLLAWTQNPTRVGDLNGFAPLRCSAPEVDAKICNGIPGSEAGLLSHCAFPDFPFYTCVRGHDSGDSSLLMTTFQYGCPKTPPTPFDPNPEQSVAPGKHPRLRCRFPQRFPDRPPTHFLPSAC